MRTLDLQSPRHLRPRGNARTAGHTASDFPDINVCRERKREKKSIIYINRKQLVSYARPKRIEGIPKARYGSGNA